MPRITSILALLALGAAACAPEKAADTGRPDMVLTIDELGSGFAPTGLLIVRLDSDSCSPCRLLDDAFDQVVGEMQAHPFLFVVLDLTNQETTDRSLQLAQEMGVRAIVEGRFSEVGSVFLIDTQASVIVETLDSGVSADDLAAAIMAVSPTGSIGYN